MITYLKYIFTLFILLFSLNVSAQNYFVCDCTTGSEPSCVAGDVGNNGTTSTTPKQLFSQLPDINTRAAGTVVSFCRGGASSWSSVVRLENPNSTKASPIRFTSYTPSWGGTAKHIIRTSGTGHGTGSAFEFGGFFDEVDDTGYIFDNLHLIGPGTNGMLSTTRGWLIWGVVDAVIFEDNEVEGFIFGWEMTNGTDGGDPQLGTGFILRGNHIHHNAMGVLGSRQDLTIENNLIEYNNNGCTTDCGFNHGLYVGTGRGFASNVASERSKRTIIRNNIVRNNSLDSSGNCSGGSITGHGRFDQFIIEGNLIETTTGTPTTTCYGISFNAGYDPEVEIIQRLIVRNNIVANVGNICVESDIGMGGALIENNQCIKTRSGGNAPNITVTLTTNTPSLTEGANANNATIRNNTFYCNVAASGTCGVSVLAGTGHSVFNNLSYIGSSGTANCYEPSALANFTIWDNNQCRQLGSGQWSSAYANLAAAQAAGFDTNGSSADPSFSATPTSPTWDLSLSSNITGRNTGKPVRDINYCQRANPPTRGAREFGDTPCLTVRSPIIF